MATVPDPSPHSFAARIPVLLLVKILLVDCPFQVTMCRRVTILRWWDLGKAKAAEEEAGGLLGAISWRGAVVYVRP